jgi:hypothetical protein
MLHGFLDKETAPSRNREAPTVAGAANLKHVYDTIVPIFSP